MQLNKKPTYINVNAMTIIKIILIFILFYVLFLIKDILALLFIALILASAIDPMVDWMQDKKIPRGVGVIFLYLVILLAFVSVITLIIPPIVEQSIELSNNFPAIMDKTSSVVDGIASTIQNIRNFSLELGLSGSADNNFANLSSNLPQAAGGVFSTLRGVIGGVFSFFIVLVITFYMVVEEKAMKKIVWSIAPPKYHVYIMGLINRMQKKIGLWLRGQLILSFIIFLLTFLVLSILGVKYALVLALIAGLTEFIPYFGPILASVPAIFLALTQSWMLGLIVAIMYYVIQWTENNIIVPKLMQKVVGLNPIVIIASLLIGLELGGFPGIILSIPVATALNVFLFDVFDNRIKEEVKDNN